ncbi:hypothetical protein [Sporomusa sphaeroides]|uniref:hypothetical protein n=1 Tax=Sporomusa sphaeroides TaxID=47679 RepID=UPI003158E331
MIGKIILIILAIFVMFQADMSSSTANAAFIPRRPPIANPIYETNNKNNTTQEEAIVEQEEKSY